MPILTGTVLVDGVPTNAVSVDAWLLSRFPGNTPPSYDDPTPSGVPDFYADHGGISSSAAGGVGEYSVTVPDNQIYMVRAIIPGPHNVWIPQGTGLPQGPGLNWRGNWSGLAAQGVGTDIMGSLDASGLWPTGNVDWTEIVCVNTGYPYPTDEAVIGSSNGVGTPGIIIKADGTWGYRDTAGTYHQLDSSGTIYGGWQLLGVTYDSATHSVIGYRNGYQCGSASGVTNTIAFAGGQLVTIGGDNGAEFYTGLVDNFVWLNTVLTAADFATLWAAQNNPDAWQQLLMVTYISPIYTWFQFEDSVVANGIVDHAGDQNGTYNAGHVNLNQIGFITANYQVGDVVQFSSDIYGHAVYIADKSNTGQFPYNNTTYWQKFAEGVSNPTAGGQAFVSYGADNTAWAPDRYNVVAYGAIGDATADCQGAFQQAINDANAAGGGVVYVPAGVYLVGAPLTWYNYVSLMGDGANHSTVIFSDQSGVGVALQNATISDIRVVDGDNTCTTATVTTDFGFCFIRNCTIGSYASPHGPPAIQTNSLTQISDCVIYAVILATGTGPGIVSLGGEASVRGLYFQGCTATADSGMSLIDVPAGHSNFKITECSADFATTYKYGAVVESGSSDNYIINNNLFHAAVTAKVLDGGSGTNKHVGNNPT